MNGFKRNGFSMVELLIVIMVIGIFAQMMMYSSTEAITSAKAVRIVNNFRNLKTAALALYAESMDRFANSSNVPSMSVIAKYLSNNEDQDISNYDIDTTAGWHLKFTITGGEQEVSRIKSKLSTRAKYTGLKKEAKDGGTGADYDGKTSVVYYFVH